MSLEETTNVLFSIGPLEVTKTVVSMWAIIAVLAIVSFLATRNLKTVPGKLQNLAEMAVEKLLDFFGGIMGAENARRYFPIMATYFIFIVAPSSSTFSMNASSSLMMPCAFRILAIPSAEDPFGISTT